ncbi:hypothetical protein TURU_012060 [Turdus rufiventris]|nr:hypothetical protein TURU_012060 [Turdus rufiventris]
MDRYGPVWTSMDQYKPVWTSMDQYRPQILDIDPKMDPIDPKTQRSSQKSMFLDPIDPKTPTMTPKRIPLTQKLNDNTKNRRFWIPLTPKPQH